MEAGQVLTVTAPLSISWPNRSRWLMTSAVLMDGTAAPLVRDTAVLLRPYQLHFPSVTRP
jgi:hypothetical protein